MEFKVYGKTPVKFIESRFICESVPVKEGTSPPEPNLPEIPNYERADSIKDIPEGSIFAPEREFSFLPGRVLTDNERDDVNYDRTLLCAYGFIKYKDVFGKKRQTKCCFVYRIPRGGVVRSPDGYIFNAEGFRIGGPDGYNKAT
jgi:hypothetical protein